MGFWKINPPATFNPHFWNQRCNDPRHLTHPTKIHKNRRRKNPRGLDGWGGGFHRFRDLQGWFFFTENTFPSELMNGQCSHGIWDILGMLLVWYLHQRLDLNGEKPWKTMVLAIWGILKPLYLDILEWYLNAKIASQFFRVWRALPSDWVFHGMPWCQHQNIRNRVIEHHQNLRFAMYHPHFARPPVDHSQFSLLEVPGFLHLRWEGWHFPERSSVMGKWCPIEK